MRLILGDGKGASFGQALAQVVGRALNRNGFKGRQYINREVVDCRFAPLSIGAAARGGVYSPLQ